jgi:hypothetical protein
MKTSRFWTLKSFNPLSEKSTRHKWQDLAKGAMPKPLVFRWKSPTEDLSHFHCSSERCTPRKKELSHVSKILVLIASKFIGVILYGISGQLDSVVSS